MVGEEVGMVKMDLKDLMDKEADGVSGDSSSFCSGAVCSD
jgi:hypothetical protein